MLLQAHERYTCVAIALHWLIALCIIGMLLLGFFMGDLEPVALKIQAYQFHKSLGITILLLSVLRLVWRLMHPAPAYPSHMKPIEKFLADASHAAFYVFMIVMPLTGWLIISSSTTKFPTHFFGTFRVPLLPVSGADMKQTHDLAEWAHYYLAWGAIALIAVHALAALRHHFFDKDTVLVSMLPRFIANALMR